MRISALLLALSFFFSGEAAAQTCKPIRANRGKTVSNPMLAGVATSLVLPSNPRQTVEQRGNEVIVREGNSEVARYQTSREGAILAPYIAYRESNEHRVDTLDPSRHGKHNQYFGYYFSYNVVSTYFPAQRKTVYYSTSSYDSLTEIRHPNSVLYYRGWQSYGSTYRSMQWTADGILQYKRDGNEERAYYSTGVLHTRILPDEKFAALRTETYYPNGVLQSLAWTAEAEPVGTWRFYDSTGTLLRTERKGPMMRSEGPMAGVAVAPPPPEIYQRVDQMLEFPTSYNLRDSLGAAVATAVRCSRAPLAGRYEVEFVLQTDGVAKLVAVRGQDADALRPTLENFFARLRGWRPGKLNGWPVSSIMQFTCAVQ